MKIKLIIRQAPDWKNMTLTEFFHHKNLSNDNDSVRETNLKKNMNGWDRLNLNMFEYRYRIQNIARSNLPYNIERTTLNDALANKLSDIIYIPIDDDDIISSDLVDKLYDIYSDSSINSVVWKTWGYSVLKNQPILFKESDRAQLVRSNCYSIRGNYITKNNLLRHKVFSESINSYYKIDEEYGIILHHPASTYKMQKRYLIDKIQVRNIDIPYKLKWAKNFINDVNTLTRRLQHHGN